MTKFLFFNCGNGKIRWIFIKTEFSRYILSLYVIFSLIMNFGVEFFSLNYFVILLKYFLFRFFIKCLIILQIYIFGFFNKILILINYFSNLYFWENFNIYFCYRGNLHFCLILIFFILVFFFLFFSSNIFF